MIFFRYRNANVPNNPHYQKKLNCQFGRFYLLFLQCQLYLRQDKEKGDHKQYIKYQMFLDILKYICIFFDNPDIFWAQFGHSLLVGLMVRRSLVQIQPPLPTFPPFIP